ncbi:MAG: DUF5677 domain-containing protein [Patescibacteria group bacterium]|nr:DUF5677 domain-containing protein [Patescibacteria group bacterium]
MEKYYQLLEQLRGIGDKCLLNHPEPQNEKEALLLYAIAKADKTLCAAALLCRNGMGEDASILCRSIFELSLTIEYIFSDQTNDLAKRYFRYDWIQRKKMYGYMIRSGRFQKYLLSTESQQIISTINKEAKKVNKKYNYGNSWSDKSIYEMANSTGLLGLYETAYRIQCNLSHSNPRSSNDYFKEEGGRLILNSGPSDNLVTETLVTVFGCYLHIVVKINDYFNKGVGADIKKIEDEFINLIKVANNS